MWGVRQEPTGIAVEIFSGARRTRAVFARRRCVSDRKSRYRRSCARGVESPHRGDISSSSHISSSYPSVTVLAPSKRHVLLRPRGGQRVPVQGVPLEWCLSFGLFSARVWLLSWLSISSRGRETRAGCVKLRRTRTEVEFVDPLRALIRKFLKFGERERERRGNLLLPRKKEVVCALDVKNNLYDVRRKTSRNRLAATIIIK